MYNYTIIKPKTELVDKINYDKLDKKIEDLEEKRNVKIFRVFRV